MPPPRLKVETIAFHGHDPSALPHPGGRHSCHRALSLYGQAAACRRRSSRRDADGHVTIRATLFCEDLAGQTVDVCASRLGGAGHAIQDVACRPVTFDCRGG